MNAIQHAVALPPEEVVIHRAAWRKILGEIAPLTTGAQNIHQAVYHRTHVGAALAAARPRRRNEWRNNRPLLVREVAWVSQMITIVSRPVFLCPHRRLSPTNQTTSFETQMIPMTPQVLRRTLRTTITWSCQAKNRKRAVLLGLMLREAGGLPQCRPRRRRPPNCWIGPGGGLLRRRRSCVFWRRPTVRPTSVGSERSCAGKACTRRP